MFGINSSLKFPKRYRDDTKYDPLQDGSNASSDNLIMDDKGLPLRPRSKPTFRFWVVLLLLATNIASLFALLYAYYPSFRAGSVGTSYVPDSWARVDALPETYVRFNWWTEYSDKNFTETDALWDDINPAHGFIAMDREWAQARHWPKTMHLPTDDSKNVYLLEAYHLVHCVGVIRKSFWEAVHGVGEENYTFHPPHAGHCIDMLRQYVMCKADNTPLYTFGDDTAGDEQYRKCTDWNALRQFATEHSACYRDYPPGADKSTFPLGAHFGYCDGGHDGMKFGKRAGNWEHGVIFDGPQ